MEEQSAASGKKPNSSRKIIRRLLIFVVIMGLIIVAMPFGIQFGIIKGLTAAGSKQVKVEDVDFNPFTGLLVVKNLQAETASEPELKVSLLSVQMDWLPLFEKHILVKSILLKGLELKVEQGKENQLVVGGLLLPAADSEEKPEKEQAPMEWGIGLGDVHFVDNAIEFTTADFSADIKITDLLLRQLFSWEPGQVADFAFETEVNNAPISGKFDISAFAENPLFEGTLKIDQFVLDHFITLAGGSLNELKGKLSTDLSFSLSVVESGIDYQQKGSIILNDSVVGVDDIQLVHQEIIWDGDVNFALKNDEIETTAKGLIKLSKHQNSLNSPELDTKIEAFEWSGDAFFYKKGEENKLKVNGDLVASGITSQNRKTKLSVLQLEKLTVDGVSIDQPENIQLSKVVLEGLAVAQKGAKRKPLMKAAQVTLDKLMLKNGADIDLESVNINTLITDININKKGDFVLLDELQASLKAKPSEPEAENKQAEAAPSSNVKKQPAIRIGKINVVGKSKLYVANAAVSDMALKKVEFKNISIGEINSLAPKKPTPFKLAATINKHSKLAMKGKITPFTDKINAQITLSLKAFELPELSPMARNKIGYEIQSGQIDVDMKASIKQDILDGKLNVGAHKLIMAPSDPEKIAKVTKQLTMPLDTALSMLTDKNDDIEMEIPIKGNVNNPDFSIRSVVNTALAKALKGSVTTYLLYALQPYGLAYMAAEAAYGAATAVVLEPVKFKEGEETLSSDSKKYLERIGSLMQERPGIRVQLCGFATPSDRLKLIEQGGAEKPKSKKEIQEATKLYQPKLLGLAKKRASVVKAHLISTYKIGADRLFSCLPKVTKETGKPPRVELLI